MPAPASDSGSATTPRRRYRDSPPGVFALLLALRIVNALTLRTFFQPDEFFQSLEPAWQLAFGHSGHAWITWEWTSRLRASLHPAIFATVYLVAGTLADACGLSPPAQAKLLLAAPKAAQAVCAALTDYYTWKLAEKAHGRGSRTAFAPLALSVCSPWQWFCSTRTLSNCLETAVTSIAVYHWPWRWQGSGEGEESARRDRVGSLLQLRISLLLAAFACMLRPTNVLIWIAVSIPTLWLASTRLRHVLVREVLFCGSAVLACGVLSDRLYYHVWTLPPLRFLYFNIAQSLAVFYGRNRPDYYLTEGLPLLLTTALPFALVGSWQALRWQPASQSPEDEQTSGSPPINTSAAQRSICPGEDIVARRILARIAWTSIIVTLSLSLIAHKEVRFLYPILPFLHVLSARPLSLFFPTPLPLSRRAVLILLLTANLLIAGYASQVHQRGVIDVLAFLRDKHEARMGSGNNTATATQTTVGFLMPCHSTPWRSHMVHPGIAAWALTCEPPLDVPLLERSSYLDEADQFYIDPGPAKWLDQHMEGRDKITNSGSRSGRHWAGVDPAKKQVGKRAWPENLVFFEQLEPEMRKFLEGTRYRECWRGFNSHFHDDWRRKGDIILWCLD